MIEVKINTSYIKLDQLLKFSNIVSSGSEAKVVIEGNNVLVNGETITQRGKKIKPGDIIQVKNKEDIKILGD